MNTKVEAVVGVMLIGIVLTIATGFIPFLVIAIIIFFRMIQTRTEMPNESMTKFKHARDQSVQTDEITQIDISDSQPISIKRISPFRKLSTYQQMELDELSNRLNMKDITIDEYHQLRRDVLTHMDTLES